MILRNKCQTLRQSLDRFKRLRDENHEKKINLILLLVELRPQYMK